MSVQRQKEDHFDATLPAIAAAVRIVLSRRPPYCRTIETAKDKAFRTNIKPSPWLLGTDMTVELQPLPTGIRVVAKTESQWFILGDVFGFYDRYLYDFFWDVKTELQSHRE